MYEMYPNNKHTPTSDQFT